MSIVVGYVPTAEGRAALLRAAAESELRKLRLVVVNSQRGGDQWSDRDAGALEQELKEVQQRLDSAGVAHEVRSLVRGKDPADDLIAVAGETGAELIVIGLRRRSAVGKLILGSNAQRILLDADYPVLAVKAPAQPLR